MRFKPAAYPIFLKPAAYPIFLTYVVTRLTYFVSIMSAGCGDIAHASSPCIRVLGQEAGSV